MARTNAIKVAASTLLGWLLVSFCNSHANALRLSPQEGDRLQHKIDEITKNGGIFPVPARRTLVTESEINSYLAYNAKQKIPQGLTNPEIFLVGDARLAGRVLVDFDEFKRHWNPQGLLDPFNYISGKVPVTARGLLRTHDGRGQFQLESAEILGVPVPKALVQELVTFFSRTPAYPNGFDIDAPFNLPAKILEAVINRAEIIVIQ